MTELEKAWAAGIIDGEAWIGIHKQSRNEKFKQKNAVYCLRLNVKMTSKPTIDRLFDIFKVGSIYGCEAHNKKNRYLWNWHCNFDQAETVLRAIQPYMITKKIEVDKAIEYIDYYHRTKDSYPKKLGVPKDILEKREQFYLELQNLKRKEWRPDGKERS